MNAEPLPTDEQRTLLVCDDRSEMREAIVRAVSTLTGFHVIGEAVDGADCLARIRELQPDTLTLDIGMPGGGTALVVAAKELKPDLQIVVFSARDEQPLRDQMMDAGADHYVVKSGRLSPLLDAVRETLAVHRSAPRKRK